MGVDFRSAESVAQARDEALGRGKYLVTDRLAVSKADGRVVPETECFEGGNLYAVPGQEIPIEEARARGLVTDDTADTKQAEPVADKAVTADEVADKKVRRGRPKAISPAAAPADAGTTSATGQ